MSVIYPHLIIYQQKTCANLLKSHFFSSVQSDGTVHEGGVIQPDFIRDDYTSLSLLFGSAPKEKTSEGARKRQIWEDQSDSEEGEDEESDGEVQYDYLLLF